MDCLQKHWYSHVILWFQWYLLQNWVGTFSVDAQKCKHLNAILFIKNEGLWPLLLSWLYVKILYKLSLTYQINTIHLISLSNLSFGNLCKWEKWDFFFQTIYSLMLITEFSRLSPYQVNLPCFCLLKKRLLLPDKIV